MLISEALPLLMVPPGDVGGPPLYAIVNLLSEFDRWVFELVRMVDSVKGFIRARAKTELSMRCTSAEGLRQGLPDCRIGVGDEDGLSVHRITG